MSATGPKKLVKPTRPRRPPSPVESVPSITVEPSETGSMDKLSEFFVGLSQWKSNVSELGSRFDKYVTRLDAIESMYLFALEKTRDAALFFAQLSDSMQLVNEFITLSKHQSTDQSTQSHIEKSLRRCDKMVASCEECCSSFLDLYNELLYIQEDIHEDINLCEQQIKEEEKSKNRLKVAHRITQAVALVAAAAASLMGAFFAFGTPLVAIPLAFSVISPIISFNINNRIEACNTRAKKPRKELDAFIELTHGLDVGSERVQMALHWWDDIKTEVKALHSEIVQGTQRSGSKKDRTAHTEQWKVLEKRMDEYASGLQELISAQRQRQSPSPSISSSTSRSSSRLSEHGFGSPQNLNSLSRSSSRSSTNSSKSESSVRSTHSQPAGAAVKKSVGDRAILQTQVAHVSWG